MRNSALIIAPTHITAQTILNNVPEAAEVSWSGSMRDSTAGSIRVPGSIPYRGVFGPLLDTHLLLLRFTPDYSANTIQTWLDIFGVSPLLLVAVWYESWINTTVGEEVSRSLRSWRVRNGMMENSTIGQIKAQLRQYFPEDWQYDGDGVPIPGTNTEPALPRLAHWQGLAHCPFDGNDDWLEDTALA